MDLKNHILINLTEKSQGYLLTNICCAWYDFSEPVERNVGGILIRESLTVSELSEHLNFPMDKIKLIDRHNCAIPIYSIGEL